MNLLKTNATFWLLAIIPCIIAGENRAQAQEIRADVEAPVASDGGLLRVYKGSEGKYYRTEPLVLTTVLSVRK